MKSRLYVLLVALAAAASLAACGGGGEASDTGGGAATTPTTKEQAIERCREEAGKLTGDAKKTAEAACEAGESGDTTAVKDAAREQCLNATKNIPDPAAKKTAEDACKRNTQ
jgi:hypothetical protein